MEIIIISLLIFLGALLLVAEIAFIPGIGITGVLGVLSFVAAVSYAFACVGTVYGWVTIIVSLAVVVALILWAIYGKTIDNVALKENITSTVKNPQTDSLKIGDEGVAVTRLALVGEADFNGHIVEVTSCDGFIDEKAAVVIARISDGVIFVKTK